MSKGKKVNPRNIPRTEEDCRREHRRGMEEGATNATLMTLWTMVDSFAATKEQIQMFEERLNYNLDSIQKGTIKPRDIYEALVNEYGVTMEWING